MGGKSRLWLLLCVFLLGACRNLPQTQELPPQESHRAHIWDLEPENTSAAVSAPLPQLIPTAQLVSAVDFDAAFRMASAPVPARSAGEGSEDRAVWNYFSPAEYSRDPIGTLYISFTNSGTSTWNSDYRFHWFAGDCPTDSADIPFPGNTPAGQEATLTIPVTSDAANWKGCWQMLNASGESFYEFCYNHGDGSSSPSNPAKSASDSSSGSSGVSWEFARTKGEAPAKAGDGYSASVSLSPESGHTFKAYDHSETISATFTNTGTQSWDESMSLRFYSGYNWFHTTSFGLTEDVEPGESITFTMPIEIIEDNDHWNTCWYLEAPNGGTVESFCFKYHTKS